LFSTGFQEVMLLKEQSRPRILRAGDSCVTVEFGSSISLEINGMVQQFRRLLEERALPGVRELVPTYRSLSVYFDPVEVDAGRFMATLESLAASTEERAEPGGKVMVVPGTLRGLPLQKMVTALSKAFKIKPDGGVAPGVGHPVFRRCLDFEMPPPSFHIARRCQLE
jgi:hypothetical protein